MQIANRNEFISTIYSAIVVNTNKSLDPDNSGRIQIYIPSINYEYADYYVEYMNSNNKTQNLDIFNAFPWAITLQDDLNEGDEVFGSFIEGSANKYIILGISKSNTTINISNDSLVSTNINGSTLVNLAMPIIMHNEIGVDISAWENDSIPNDKFSSITLHDGGTYNSSTGQWIKQGCWAIGLIQWNGVRAYDTCYEIALEDSNWKSYFTNDCDLKSALNTSILSRSTINQRGSFSIEKGWNPEKNGATYNAIIKLLSSDIAKTVQKRLAYNDTADIINKFIESGCNNPVILIYMADFCNQYGSNLPETIKKAAEVCNQGGNLISQLEWLIENQLKPNFKSFNTYSNRRRNTMDYVKELYTSGKFNNTMTDIGNNDTDIQIVGTGAYCMPVKGHIKISAGFGNSKNSGGQGYTNSSHNGMDFAIAEGTPIYACTSGNAKYVEGGDWGNHVFIYANDGNLLVLAHMSAFEGSDRTVVKGEKIGYVGSTGNSTGAHVHLGITDVENGTRGLYNANVGLGKNPAIYLGIENKRDVYIDV